jgi:molecular chaperone GrpE
MSASSEESKQTEETAEEEAEKSELELLAEENEALKREAAEAADRALRAAAELDNFRKRMIKETEDRIKFAGSKIIESLLPVMDNLQMALEHSDSDSGRLKEGVELTLKIMKEALARHGLEEISIEPGTEFDPGVHEALMLDSTDEYENNKVTMVLQSGYTLNGRVLRPGKVKVNKK